MYFAYMWMKRMTGAYAGHIWVTRMFEWHIHMNDMIWMKHTYEWVILHILKQINHLEDIYEWLWNYRSLLQKGPIRDAYDLYEWRIWSICPPECSLFYRALLQKRPIILRGLLIVRIWSIWVRGMIYMSDAYDDNIYGWCIYIHIYIWVTRMIVW